MFTSITLDVNHVQVIHYLMIYHLSLLLSIYLKLSYMINSELANSNVI